MYYIIDSMCYAMKYSVYFTMFRLSCAYPNNHQMIILLAAFHRANAYYSTWGLCSAVADEPMRTGAGSGAVGRADVDADADANAIANANADADADANHLIVEVVEVVEVVEGSSRGHRGR